MIGDHFCPHRRKTVHIGEWVMLEIRYVYSVQFDILIGITGMLYANITVLASGLVIISHH